MSRLFSALLLALPPLSAAPVLPTLAEALASPLDLWGEAALRQPDGPSYEFFAPLLPPPRYVNADFRHYPIVLSAPGAAVKARLISNGSGVNLRGGARSWHDQGMPFTFRVGPDEFVFGSLADRTEEPELADGYLPIVTVRYRHPSPVQSEGAVPLDQKRPDRVAEVYALEAFAAVDGPLAAHGVVLVRFALTAGTTGTVSVNTDPDPSIRFAAQRLTNAAGETVAWFDRGWKWERNRAVGKITRTSTLVLAIATKPLPADVALDLDYATQRAACVARWNQILDGGMQVTVPEARVNHAARNLIIQNHILTKGDRLHYSAGNQYDQLYEAEGSDAMLAQLAWGYVTDARRLTPALLDFTRKGLEHHQASFKLLDICRLYWMTRDPAVVRDLRPRWDKELRRLMAPRSDHGLLPAERYAGDISTPAQTINANAHAWRALRDLAAVLAEIGETTEAASVAAAARTFRPIVQQAIEANARHTTTPPFLPVALFADEPTHDPIVRTRIGSYWNIVIGYTIGSGIFPPGDPRETWIPRYQEQHGGLFLGLLRSGGDAFNFWTGEHRVNPLYGTRYALDTLRRDDPDRALVGFYGLLAQGFTRNTFIGGEGATLDPVDDRGRFFYCPPNSAGNAHFLSLLRNLLVQDWDLDDDGRPDTLRLLHATPRAWLADGQTLRVERAPTAFGEVSFEIKSQLASGRIIAAVSLPERNPAARTLLRLRPPDGWNLQSAHLADGTNLPLDPSGTVDLSLRRGRQRIEFSVAR
jgi:hypothetical protein